MENNIPAGLAKKYRSRRKDLEVTDGIKISNVVAQNILLPTDEYDEARYQEVISNNVGEKDKKSYGVCGIACSSQHHKLIILISDYIQQKYRLYKRGEIKQEIENEIKVIIGSDEPRNYEQLIINSNDLALDYFNKPKVGGTEVRKVLAWLYDLSNYRILLSMPGGGFGFVTPIFIPYLPLTGNRPKDFVIYVCPEFAHTDNKFLLIPRKQAEKLQRQSPLYINLLYLLEMNKYRSGGVFRIQKQKLFKQIAKYKRYKVKRFIIEDYKNAITELINDGVITNYEEEIKFKDTYAVFHFPA